MGEENMFYRTITSFPQFSRHSLEELRWQDYKVFGIYKPPSKAAWETLSEDLKMLIGSELFSDVTFVVEGKKIHSHRNILAARSDKFRAMFGSGMKETHEEVVEIDDIPYPVFLAMLEYVVTGSTGITPDISLDLLAVADEYFLERLKELCEEYLVDFISDENIVNLLVYSDRHSAFYLKRKCIEYILKNFTSEASDQWKQLDRRLLEEMFATLCNVFSGTSTRYRG